MSASLTMPWVGCWLYHNHISPPNWALVDTHMWWLLRSGGPNDWQNEPLLSSCLSHSRLISNFFPRILFSKFGASYACALEFVRRTPNITILTEFVCLHVASSGCFLVLVAKKNTSNLWGFFFAIPQNRFSPHFFGPDLKKCERISPVYALTMDTKLSAITPLSAIFFAWFFFHHMWRGTRRGREWYFPLFFLKFLSWVNLKLIKVCGHAYIFLWWGRGLATAEFRSHFRCQWSVMLIEPFPSSTSVSPPPKKPFWKKYHARTHARPHTGFFCRSLCFFQKCRDTFTLSLTFNQLPCQRNPITDCSSSCRESDSTATIRVGFRKLFLCVKNFEVIIFVRLISKLFRLSFSLIYFGLVGGGKEDNPPFDVMTNFWRFENDFLRHDSLSILSTTNNLRHNSLSGPSYNLAANARCSANSGHRKTLYWQISDEVTIAMAMASKVRNVSVPPFGFPPSNFLTHFFYSHKIMVLIHVQPLWAHCW